MTLGYAPFSLWPIVPVSVAVFFYLLHQSNEKQAKITGFLFGLGWFGAGLSWVHVSIADFGGLPLLGSIGLMLLLCGYLALFPALASHFLRKYFRVSIWPLAVPIIWLLSEWLRSWLFTGFPWLSLGYSQINSPLSGWIPVIGEMGLSMLLVTLCCALGLWVPAKKGVPAALITSIIFVSGWSLNQYNWVTITGKTINIAMVQGNIKQELRWVPEQDWPTLEKYSKMTSPHWDNDIIIWPEAAVPKLEPTVREFLGELDENAARHGVGLITGIVNYNFETGQAFNNLIGLGKKSATDKHGHYRYLHNNRYSKHHLLPIGEVIPFEDWLRGLAPIFDLPMSSFTRGDYQQKNLISNGYHLAPAICFEIAFPTQIRANLYEGTDFIITVSNDAWFGTSHGPAQHLEIAQVRAKEFGIPVLRATNNGITAFIDHQGQIQSRLPQFEAAVLSDAIKQVQGTTPYRTFGDVPAWLMAIISFLFALFIQRK